MAVDKSGVGANAGDTNLTRFRKTVLTWDYLRLLRESSQKDPRDATETGLKRVKDRYEDVEEYLGVFEPLLFEEVKAQIVQVNEEDVCQEKGAVVSCEESGGFHLVTLVVQDEFPDVTENDLLLLSKEKFEEGKLKTYTFALVESRGNDHTVKARTFLSGEVNKDDKLDAEARRRRLRMLPILTKNETIQTTLHILKVCSLSTIIREYLALHSVVSLPFKNLILSATDNSRDSKLDNNKWNVPRPLMEFLENSHNESQLEAIRAGLARRPFVLIQGPPGTGKTQTILGLLSAVLHSAPSRVQSTGKVLVVKHKAAPLLEEKYRHWTKASPWLIGVNPRDLIMPIDGDDGFYPTSGNEMKPEVVNSNRKYRVHVLVCAPSNSALDEIVLRVLRTGIRDENDDVYNPKIVRIGLKAHHSVQAVSMDYLVEQKLASMDPSTFGKGSASGPMDRDRIRASILDESAIVFSTLSFSGSSHFSRMNRIFDVVIIDEAAQAVEPATLIPFAHGCRQVYLVGDPAQLPATVISTTAKKLGYDTSLFKRFQKAGYPVQMLKTQYRMHPEIRSFPSKEFYSDSLEDGELVEKQTKRLWHDYRCFGPFCFFDIEGVESQPSGSGSLKNEDEIDFILLMYKHLITNYPELKSSSQIAVISPYNEQVKEFRKKFNEIFGKQSNQFVDVNTVDGFQGREKDVAIFSCVRANSGKGIGFVSDVRRMNVGITRARSSILVVGSATTLMQDKHWSNLIESAKLRDCYFKVSKPSSSFFSEANLKSLERIRTKEIKPDQLDEHIAAMENIAVETGEEAPIDDVDMDDGGDGGYDE